MRRRNAGPAILLLAVLFVSCNKPDKNATPAGTPPAGATAAAPDFEKIAQSIITRTVAVREGDVVLISGPPRDLELLEDLNTWAQKQGGSPIVVLSTERMTRRSFDDVPEKYDTMKPAWDNLIVRNATVSIAVENFETPDLLAHVPPARIAVRAAAAAGLPGIAMARGIRTLSIGNGMYPTHARAARFGMSREQLASFFWSALNADFTDIQNNAKYLIDAMGNAKEIHVTDPNGTDVRFTVTKKRWIVSDGISKPTDKGSDNFKYLPAGEIFSVIDPGSAEGTIVVDKYWANGKTIDGLTLKVSKGKVVSMTAKTNMEELQKSFDATQHAGKSDVTALDFGLNPGIKASAAASLRTWVPEGMVTIVTGGDEWAGGTNSSPFGISGFLAGATVTADGKVIIENGNIKR